MATQRPLPSVSLLRSLRPHRLIIPHRTLTQTPSLPRKSKPSTTTQPRRTHSPPQIQTSAARQSTITALLSAPSPVTTLYTSPPSPLLPLTALTFGTSSFLFTLNALYTVLDPDPVLGENAPWFARGALLLPGLLGAVIGTYVLNSGRRHLRAIRAVTVPAQHGAREVVLEIEPRTYLRASAPFRVPLSDMRLVERVAARRSLGVMGSARTVAGLRAVAAEEMQRSAFQAQPSGLGVFGKIGFYFNRFMSLFRRMYTRDGLMRVLVKRGGRWRRYVVDVDEGWLLREGEVLERLVELRED